MTAGAQSAHFAERSWQRFRDISARNATLHRELVTRKIAAVLQAAGSAEPILATAASIVGENRASLAVAAHVSINLRAERLLSLVATGELAPSQPANSNDRQIRINAEGAFASPTLGAPVYGALNWSSDRGGAPAFEPLLWIELRRETMTRTTFTSRNTYDVTNPYLSDFDAVLARQRLERELFVWDDVLDYCLNRFWTIQEKEFAGFIEAQVWGGLRMEHVNAIHVDVGYRSRLVERIEGSNAAGENKRAALDMLGTFSSEARP